MCMVLLDLQDNACQLKQETNDLKQQLLVAQVRHNRICIYMRLVCFFLFVLDSFWMLLIIHTSALTRIASSVFLCHFQATVSKLKQQMLDLHQQLLGKQVGNNCVDVLHTFLASG